MKTKKELAEKYADIKGYSLRTDGNTTERIETSHGGPIELSPLAKKIRNEHSSRYKKAHPEKNRQYILRHWENVAKDIYGKDYKGPTSPDRLSEHAKEARRRYQREYKKKNADKYRKYYADYWEKKARALLAELEKGDA